MLCPLRGVKNAVSSEGVKDAVSSEGVKDAVSSEGVMFSETCITSVFPMDRFLIVESFI